MIATSRYIGGHTSRRKCGDMESRSEICGATWAQKSQSSCIAKKSVVSVVSVDVATEQTDKNECGARDTNSRDKLIRNSHLMGGQAYKGHEWS